MDTVSTWVAFQLAITAGFQTILAANHVANFVPSDDGDLIITARIRGKKITNTVRVVWSADVKLPELETENG